MHAEFISLLLFFGCSVLVAEQPVATAVAPAQQHLSPQRPLQAQSAELALVFIGGFGDEISGIIDYMARQLPPLAENEARAYYHWNGGVVEDATRGYQAIADAVSAFRAKNPGADVVLIGHSMGAATALKAAELLPASATPKGRIFLVTLDPADRVVQPIRPASVHWWGNAYVVNSQSGHDFIAAWGGRWNHCKQADVNIRFNGLKSDEYGYEFIHDNALSLFMSRRGSVSLSLFQSLKDLLSAGRKPRSSLSVDRRILLCDSTESFFSTTAGSSSP